MRVQGRWVPGLHPAPRGGGARHRPGAQPRVLPEGPPGQHARGVQRERGGAAGHGLLRLRAGAHPAGHKQYQPLPLQRQGAAGRNLCRRGEAGLVRLRGEVLRPHDRPLDGNGSSR